MFRPADRPPLLVFADDWGRHPSSCQHLVRRLRENYRVLWANTIGTRRVRANAFTVRRGIEKIRNWRKGLVQVDRQMWTLDLPMLPMMKSGWMRAVNQQLVSRRLNAALRQLDLERPLVLTTLPFVGWMVRDIPRRGLIYYCVDDFSHWPEADRDSLQAAEQDLCQEADLRLCVSQALIDRLSNFGPCEYLPHGVDREHFASVQWEPAAPALAEYSRPRVGFFGLMYEKLNFELLTSLARALPHVSLVMVGPIVYCPEEFRALPNVHLVGAQQYQDLPKWIAGLDVLLLPYVRDGQTLQSSPLKLRECLASGKPIVSVDVPDVRPYSGVVRIASSADDFVRHVSSALAEVNDPSAMETRQASVAGDGWDSRAADLTHWLDALTQQESAPTVLS